MQFSSGQQKHLLGAWWTLAVSQTSGMAGVLVETRGAGSCCLCCMPEQGPGAHLGTL